MKNLFAKPTALILTASSIAVRLLPHLPNMTPVGATATFGGAKLARPWNYLAPLFILFLTDLVLGFHNLMPYVYGCFILNVFLAEKLLKSNTGPIGLTALASANAVIFFLVTNFGVWLQSGLYAHTTTGLIEAYLLGLPFLGNMLIGDVLFTLGVFALYGLLEKSPNWQKFDKKLSLRLLEDC